MCEDRRIGERPGRMRDNLGREEALTALEARRLLLKQNLKTPGSESIPIDEAYSRVLASDVVSAEDLPGFDRSTMDGYAVAAADTFGASDTLPVYLEIKGQVAMGEAPNLSIARGETATIPTGGMLPAGADAIVMFEYTSRIDDATVEIMKSVSPGEHVIRADEDVKKGQTVLVKGRRLRPQDIGALAGLGILEAEVHRKPVVAIIGTGDEIVPPDRPVSTGMVRDINSSNLAGLVQGCHAIPVRKGIVRDDLETLGNVVREALSASDMVLITGGSSVGTRDYTAKVIDELGEPGVLFHGVAMKPGKPLIAGLVDGKPLFGMPGHPAAITVSFDNFVDPLLRRLSGEKARPHLPDRRTLIARFGRNLASTAGREEHVRVAIQDRDGALWAVPILGKSGLVSTLVNADGVIVIPMNKTGLYEGEEVEVRLFES